MMDTEKGLDSQLWHACAGGMVQMPAVSSKVYYFPQGQVEHSQGYVDFGTTMRIPALTLCRVLAVKYMADGETDEVYSKIQLVPIHSSEPDYGEDDTLSLNSSDAQEKPASFAKTLTQSDANNGGGFSVPRYCAETIFPRLDYTTDPPVQTVLAKDVHGKIWKFRHIYRGTPRRHLLTTGWSNFVNEKKLIAGDSIVFLRTENGELCVGIRRAKRGIGGGMESPPGWNPPAGNCISSYGMNYGRNIRGKGRVRPESVIEAATLATTGQPFEVVYYPRASTPEFCVKAALVRAAMRVNWCSGMRFKMAFETEDSSRISWFMGTISSVQVADPIRWLNSPWRLLQVTWDEPDLLQNVKRVSPWLVELVSNMPSIHLAPISPPRKKLRITPHPDFLLDRGSLPTPTFSGNPLGPIPAGIQGARHAQFGISLSDIHLNNLQSGLFHAGFHRPDPPRPPRITTGLIISDPTMHSDVSCLLTIGHPSHATKKSCNVKPHFVLFGQPILTEEQISQSSSRDTVSPGATGNSSSDGNPEKTNGSDGSGSANDGFPWYRDPLATELGLETGHCKVFLESEDVGRTLNLSAIGSYEGLYRRLTDMFGVENSEIMSNVSYRDAAGALKHTGDQPFSEFMRTARRLTILTDASSDNIGS